MDEIHNVPSGHFSHCFGKLENSRYVIYPLKATYYLSLVIGYHFSSNFVAGCGYHKH